MGEETEFYSTEADRLLTEQIVRSAERIMKYHEEHPELPLFSIREVVAKPRKKGEKLYRWKMKNWQID